MKKFAILAILAVVVACSNPIAPVASFSKSGGGSSTNGTITQGEVDYMNTQYNVYQYETIENGITLPPLWYESEWVAEFNGVVNQYDTDGRDLSLSDAKSVYSGWKRLPICPVNSTTPMCRWF